jgi:hypothetical protein
MEQKIKEIIRHIGDIGEKVSRLLAEESLPTIEMDIILGDIRVLYEKVKDLQPGKGIPGRETLPGPGTATAGEEEAISGETKTTVAVPKLTAQEETTGGAETIAGAGRQEHPDGTVTPEAAEEVPAAKTGASGKTGKQGTSTRPSERAVLADKYKNEQTFINESLAGSRGKQNISSQIQSKPIRNIGSALGINDRFKLINELFNGDRDSFQDTIGILDGAANFNEAFNYINSSFDWDMEEDSVQLLLDLVRRKFIVNQNE